MYLCGYNLLNAVLVLVFLSLKAEEANSRSLSHLSREDCFGTVIMNTTALNRLREFARRFRKKNKLAKHFTLHRSNPFDPRMQCSNRYNMATIISGEEAKPHSLPWMVFIKAYFEDAIFLCAGVLISDRWILTAAHCLTDTNSNSKLKYVYVVLGLHDLDNCVKERAKTYKIFPDGVFANDQFSLVSSSVMSIENDLGLIRVPDRIKLNLNIVPACISLSLNAPQVGDICVAAGWGKVNYSIHHASHTLQRLDVQVKDCKYDPFKKICVGIPDSVTDDTQDTCEGDSGGPLICKVHGVQTAMGILSSGGNDCSTAHGLSHYTNIYFYLEWMKKIIYENGGY